MRVGRYGMTAPKTTRLAVTLRLYDTEDPKFGWEKQDEIEVGRRLAAQLLELSVHRPIDMQPYRDRWGMWSLFMIDLAR